MYHKTNKTLPAIVAIHRDGVGGPSYKEKVIRNEIEDIMKLIQTYSNNYKPQILFTLVDKRINTKVALTSTW